MRDATLAAPRTRAFSDDRGATRRKGARRTKPSLLSRAFGARRLSMTLVLGIAGLAAIGVPMNALFFQDGHHPAPLFAAQIPVPAAPVADDAAPAPAKVDAPRAANAKIVPVQNDVAPPAGADLASAELARLAADPNATVGAKPAHSQSKAVKPEAATLAPAKPAPTKADAANATAKANAINSAKPIAKSAPTPALAAEKATAVKMAPAKPAAAAKTADKAATPKAAAKNDDHKTIAAAEATHNDGPLGILSQFFGGAPKTAPAAEKPKAKAEAKKAKGAPAQDAHR